MTSVDRSVNRRARLAVSVLLGTIILSCSLLDPYLPKIPKAPQGITVSSPTSTSLKISWHSVTGAVKYDLYRDTAATGSFTNVAHEGSGTSFVDTGLNPSTTYYYKVNATNDIGTGPGSAVGAGTTLAGSGGDSGAPAIPTGLEIDASSPDTISISWKRESGQTYYQVYRKPGASPTITTSSPKVYDGAEPYYVDSDLTTGATYSYRVLAMNENGESDLSKPISFAPTAATHYYFSPPTPTGLTLIVNDDNSVSVSWGITWNTTDYALFRDSTENVTSSSTVIYAGPNLSYTDSGLISGTTYFYAVAAGNPAGASALCSAQSVTIPVGGNPAGPATPTNLTQDAGTSTTASISWAPSTGATSYQVYRKINSATNITISSPKVYDGTAPHFIDKNVVVGNAYYYKVRATNADGSSLLSSDPLEVDPTSYAWYDTPPVPTGLTASVSGPSSAYVSWDTMWNTTEYDLHRSTKSTVDSNSPIIYSGANTSYTDSPIAAGTTYYYAVCSANPSLVSELSSPKSVSIPAASPVLTVTSGANGSVSPAGSMTVTSGQQTAITATANTDYVFSGWTVVSGTGVTFGDSTAASTTVTLSSGSATIKASFVSTSVTLTVQSGGNGSVNPSGAKSVTIGTATSISATPNSNYAFTSWTVVSGNGVSFGNASAASTTVTLSSGSATIQANFAIQIYTLTVQSDGYGTVSPSGSNPVSSGASTGITATPHSGYSFTGWTVVSGSGVSFGNAASAHTTVSLTAGNATIKAGFVLVTYKLTILTDGGGTVSPAGTTDVVSGAATPITAIPNSNRLFVDWKNISGSSTIADLNSASTTVTLSNGDATIEAVFVRTITTAAGSGSPGYSGDGGQATSATLNGPMGVAADGNGNLFISEYSNHIVRKVDSSSTISTLYDVGFLAIGVAVDSSGNVYVANNGASSTIWKIDAAGTTETLIAGISDEGYAGDGGPADEAALNRPQGLAMDGAGNLYIADTGNGVIRKIDTSGTISTVAGNGTLGDSCDGGAAISAELNTPTGVAVDSSGNLYIADTVAHRVRKVSGGIITAFAGTGTPGSGGDGGSAALAQFSMPQGVAVDAAGTVYIVDSGTGRVRVVNGSGNVSTIAGGGSAAGDGGSATDASLGSPVAIGVDGSGSVYICDISTQRVRKLP